MRRFGAALLLSVIGFLSQTLAENAYAQPSASERAKTLQLERRYRSSAVSTQTFSQQRQQAEQRRLAAERQRNKRLYGNAFINSSTSNVRTAEQQQQHLARLQEMRRRAYIKEMAELENSLLEQQWFRVELLIFAHQTLKSDATNQALPIDSQEAWPTIKLHYSTHVVQIQDLDPNAQTYLNTASNLEGLARLSEIKLSQLAFTRISSDWLPIPEDPTPFSLIQERLEKLPYYQTMINESWVQPIFRDRDMPHILFSGGKQFGNHFEFEGTIKLSLRRYLHLETNLWMSSFVPRRQSFTQQLNQKRQVAESRMSKIELRRPALPPRPKIMPFLQTLSKVKGLDEQHNFYDSSNVSKNSLHSSRSSAYRPIQIAPMLQKRRLRSQQWTYIDHPLFGLLARLLPVELKMSEEERRILSEEDETEI